MGRERKYRIARVLNLINLTLIILLYLGLFFYLFTLTRDWMDVIALLYIAPVFLVLLIMPIVTHIILTKEIKQGSKKPLMALGICTIIFTCFLIIGIISGILIINASKKNSQDNLLRDQTLKSE